MLRRRRTDHPRSRGVYAPARLPPPSAPGSSPLARGLRPLRLGTHCLLRIIPARAGFTSSFLPIDSPIVGSSPLARGLRHGAMLRERLSRIIPARAGFTSPAPPDPWQPADHPRSRGVYAGETVPVARHLGSSPLARGLRRRCWARPTAAGIIPARAGFTPDD